MSKNVCDSKRDYEKLLEKLKEAFEERWVSNEHAASSGLDDYEQLAVLGVGSFGRVKLIRHPVQKNYFAVKIMLKEYIVKHKQVAHVFNEKRVLQAIDYPLLVNLEFARKDNDYIYLAMPFVTGGELFSFHRKMKKFNEKQAKFYAVQVFMGLEYLHGNQLVYRDLKPENILIERRGYIKITDFGFAKRVADRTMTLCGTPEYLAPELIQAKPYGTSVDWWAFGILLYEFVSGHSPFAADSKDPMRMYSKICECDYKMPLHFSRPLRDLINNLLQVDLSKRYGNLVNGNKDIKNHEWFKAVDWCSYYHQEVEPPYVPVVPDEDETANFDKYPNTPLMRSPTNQHEEFFLDF